MGPFIRRGHLLGRIRYPSQKCNKTLNKCYELEWGRSPTPAGSNKEASFELLLLAMCEKWSRRVLMGGPNLTFYLIFLANVTSYLIFCDLT